MPVPLRDKRLEALNIAIATGEAVFSVWSRQSILRQKFFVGASACFEGELYDLTDVGWVLRENGKEKAFALSPTEPCLEGDHPLPDREQETAEQMVSKHSEVIAAALESLPALGETVQDEADQLEQTFVEELGIAAEVQSEEQHWPSDTTSHAGGIQSVFNEAATNLGADPVEPEIVEAQVQATPEIKLEEQPIVRTPGRARQKVEA